MTIVVFDTNVIVSGMLSPDGPPGRIVEWLVEGDIRAVYDDRIIAEYERVLQYPRLKLPGAAVDIVLARIIRLGVPTSVTRKSLSISLPHAGDEPFAQCALTAGVPLVTGNGKHFPPEIMAPIPVLSPSEYVQVLEQKSFEPRRHED
jgi:hypothetical protein